MCQHDLVPHPFDRLAGLALRLTPGSSVFPDGWGDRLTLELFDRFPMQTPSDPIDVAWGRKAEHRGFRRLRGMFTSPVADQLPEQGRVVPVELMEPSVGSDRVVLLMPAWNDEGFERRRSVAELLTARGIATVMMEVPMYGHRRIHPGGNSAIATVADFALMGLGAISEGEAMLKHLTARYRRVGVGGFSMGANLAALLSAQAPTAVASGLMAASYSPGPVYLDGVLRHGVNWETLGGRETEADLRSLLTSVSALVTPARDYHRAAVIVAGTGDGFVLPRHTERLAEHWKGCEVRWLNAGHATLWWRHRSALAEAISDSFSRLDGVIA